jgi:soluble lytic murein transglycosylase-like protein
MDAFRQLGARLRGRVAFPALAVAVGVSTLAAGLGHTAFLGHDAAVTHVADSTGSALASITRGLQAASAGVTSLAPAAPGTPETVASAAPRLDSGLEHHSIDGWVRRITTSARADFQRSLDRMDQYSAMITGKLDERGMPRDLIYLALIESNFNPTAKSRVSAVGMWQFMSATARQFGLKVGGGHDERKDPAKATDAALSYLSDLHARFGSWYLAAAAYNSGQGTVSRALRKVTGRTTGTDADFFRILSVLPKETQDYVPKLIASARVGSDPARYGMN